jgi:hypothetical protein
MSYLSVLMLKYYEIYVHCVEGPWIDEVDATAERPPPLLGIKKLCQVQPRWGIDIYMYMLLYLYLIVFKK